MKGGGFERLTVELQISGGVHQSKSLIWSFGSDKYTAAISNGTLNRGLPEGEPGAKEMSSVSYSCHSLIDLVRQSVVLFDGALGTKLIARGLFSGEAPEKWNVEKPEVVKEIHLAYFSAGFDVVQTNTFGGNRLKLSDKWLEGDLLRIKQAAVRLAKEVCPPGKLIAPLGRYGVWEIEAVFTEQGESSSKQVPISPVVTVVPPPSLLKKHDNP